MYWERHSKCDNLWSLICLLRWKFCGYNDWYWPVGREELFVRESDMNTRSWNLFPWIYFGIIEWIKNHQEQWAIAFNHIQIGFWLVYDSVWRMNIQQKWSERQGKRRDPPYKAKHLHRSTIEEALENGRMSGWWHTGTVLLGRVLAKEPIANGGERTHGEEKKDEMND